jgi:hypothetical protein
MGHSGYKSTFCYLFLRSRSRQHVNEPQLGK